jgi:hypothetical protein
VPFSNSKRAAPNRKWMQMYPTWGSLKQSNTKLIIISSWCKSWNSENDQESGSLLWSTSLAIWTWSSFLAFVYFFSSFPQF